MAFTKIQPQQLQLPTFTSPSGDFSFSDLSTGIEINLSRSISGPININDLTVGSSEVLKLPSSSSVSSTSVVLAGTNNTVTGTNNVVINGSSNSEISGSFNVLINGTSVDFGASGQNNTIIAGDTASFSDKVTGSVILADHETTINNDTNHSLIVSFASGVTFENGDVQFNDDVQFNGDTVVLDSNLRVNADNPVLFSGRFQVDGDAYFSNSVTLDDSSEAASQHWVGTRITHNTSSAVVDEVEGFAGVPHTDLENILTGVNAYASIVTGHIITGADESYLVFTSPTFTGAIPFSGLFTAI